LPIVAEIISSGHTNMGAYVKIMGALREKKIRIPLRRLEVLLVGSLPVHLYLCIIMAVYSNINLTRCV
jgi:hypothetical protein